MTRRCVKAMFALLLVLGIGLAFAVSPAATAPLVLDWQVIGKGVVSGTCSTTVLFSGCTATGSGDALGTHIGNSAYTFSVTTGPAGIANSSGGLCFAADGTGSVTAANGDVINFKTVGWLCEEGASGTAFHYNGTYRNVPGTGRFTSVVGGGSLASTFGKGGANFIKIDGTINF